MVRVMIVDHPPGGGLLEKDQWSLEGERGLNEKSNCNVRLRAMQRKGRLLRTRRLRQPRAWISGVGTWQLDMPNIEDGVHSVLLAKERVKLIDGLKQHETTGIRNFIWITLSWAE